jgi:hypothetical protein
MLNAPIVRRVPKTFFEVNIKIVKESQSMITFFSKNNKKRNAAGAASVPRVV